MTVGLPRRPRPPCWLASQPLAPLPPHPPLASQTTLVVSVPAVTTAAGFKLVVELACPDNGGCSGAGALLSGLRGIFYYTLKAKATLDEARLCPGESSIDTGATQTLAATGAALTHEAVADSDLYWSRVQGIPSLLEEAQAELEAMVVDQEASEWRKARALALMEAAAAGLA